jgi:outer membrane protein assembly factor BamB
LIAPLVADGTVYTVDDVLTALNARTGEHRWQTDLGIEESPNSATRPAVAGDRLLLASDGRLRSFDASDGSERWKRDVTGSPAQPVTVAPDRQMGFVFLRRPERGGTPSELVAFAVESGDTEWTAPLKALRAPPAVVGDSVYVAGWSGPETQVLRCLGLDDGKLVWEREVEDQTTPPVGTDTGVLIGEGPDIAVYDRSDGERLESVSVPQGQVRALAVDDGTAFVLAESGLLAVSVPDGSQQWSRSGESDYAQANGLAVGRETVVAPVFPEPLDASPSIAAFDRTDGTPRWHYAIDEAFSPMIVAPPVLADGAVFAMSNTENGVTALGDLPAQEEATSSG